MEIQISEEAIKAASNFKLPSQLEFGKLLSPIMAIAEFKNNQWSQPKIIPYQKLELDPCAKVFHYGQEIFEGMKAFKNEKGEVSLYRPLENFKRFNHSARRMAMPEVSEDFFMSSVIAMVKHSKEFIPTTPGYSLYLRPMMFASEVSLGIKPAEEFIYLVVASPSGSYFKQDSVKVFIERNYTRAAPGGMGSAKTGGNYAGSLLADKQNKDKGYHQTMWLDAVDRTYVEEMSGMNFFAVINNELYTPPLSNTILAGITRDSVIVLAKELGMKVHEEKINVNTLRSQIRFGECTEAFVCGTAAILTPIESLHDADETYSLKFPTGKISKEIRSKLFDLQRMNVKDTHDWILKI